jgi:hypothetical protein
MATDVGDLMMRTGRSEMKWCDPIEGQSVQASSASQVPPSFSPSSPSPMLQQSPTDRHPLFHPLQLMRHNLPNTPFIVIFMIKIKNMVRDVPLWMMWEMVGVMEHSNVISPNSSSIPSCLCCCISICMYQPPQHQSPS